MKYIIVRIIGVLGLLFLVSTNISFIGAIFSLTILGIIILSYKILKPKLNSNGWFTSPLQRSMYRSYLRGYHQRDLTSNPVFLKDKHNTNNKQTENNFHIIVRNKNCLECGIMQKSENLFCEFCGSLYEN